MSFFEELKRRNVLRVALAYLAGAWLLLQVADVLIDNDLLPGSVFQSGLLILAIGFPVALILAWALEITPTGVKLEKDVDRSRPTTTTGSKKFDRIVIVVLAVAVAYFAYDKFASVDGPADKSIAVLPFINMSEDAGNEYFADGISEEMLNLLTKIPELRVISRSSAFSFKGQDVNISEIAKQLNVAHILEGSVRKSGNQVRITAQLIDARTDTHLWSETYDRTLDDIFSIQDEIAGEVVGQLKITLLGEVAKADEVDPAAYTLFLQARHILNQYDSKRLAQAEELLKQALEIEPDYAMALAELSRTYSRQNYVGQRSDEETEPLIRETMARALAIDPNNGLIQLYMGGMIRNWDKDYVAAAPHVAHAIELAPNDAYIVRLAGSFARDIGRYDISNALSEHLLTLDPLCTDCKFRLALGYRVAGRLDDADTMLREVLLLDPDFPSAHFLLGTNQLLRGNPEAALAEFEQAVEDERAEGEILTYHDLGRDTEFEAAFSQLREQPEIEEVIAEIYAWIGDADSAFEWLDKMYELYQNAPVNFPKEPMLRNIHDDPRWNELLKKLGKSREQLAAIEFNPKLPE